MIDLCIDARMAFSSGIGVFLRQIVVRLNQPPFRLILLVDQTGREWCGGMEQVLFPSPIYSIQEQFFFPIKIPCCDLFWSPHYNAPIFPTRAKKRIVTIHDTCHLSLPNCFSALERIYARRVMGNALYRSDCVATVSNFTKSELFRHFPKIDKEIAVVPNGIDTRFFHRICDPERMLQLRKQYGLPESFILCVGNVKLHKNLSAVIQAFLELDDPRLSQWQLVIVGKKQGMRNTDRIKENRRVLRIEAVPDEDLPGFYSIAKLFVFPSLYEGFGMPPLEAMACGCPTIVSKAASLPEVCSDASIYINPTVPKEIAVAILKVAFDKQLQQTLVQKGLARALRFDWNKAADAYATLFKKVRDV